VVEPSAGGWEAPAGDGVGGAPRQLPRDGQAGRRKVARGACLVRRKRS
jgi:hypothetical protein